MENKIYLFTMYGCDHCNETKKKLIEEKIDFTDLDIVLYHKQWDEVVEKIGTNIVPTLLIRENEETSTVYLPNVDFNDVDGIIEIIKKNL